MKPLGKRPANMTMLAVTRGCYCGALCSCYKTPTIKSAYGAVKAASWSSADVDL